MARKVNIERGEVLELPGFGSSKVGGAKHEQGGVDATLPTGTRIYSDTLKIGDQTIAERKAARDKRLEQITKAFTKDKSNILLKNSFNRVKEANDFEDEKDLTFQQTAKDMLQDTVDQSFALGTGPDGLDRLSFARAGMNPRNEWARIPGIDPMMETMPLLDPIGLPTNPAVGLETDKLTKFASGMKTKGNKAQAELDALNPVDTSMGFTTGDIVGTVGSVVGSVSQMANTIANAKATKPVVNHYAGFNEKALAANQKTKDQIGYNKDAAKAELERTLNLAENNARARTRGSATSLSTLRSLDLGVDMNTNEAKVGGKNQLDSVYGNQLLTALGVDTQLLSQKDQMEMAGATAADDANAANLDNFYSNFAQNIAGATNTIQELGKNINESKHRNDFLKLLPQTNAWSVGVDKDMKMTAPTTEAKKYVTPVKTITELPASDYMNLDFMNTMNLKIPKYSFNSKR